MQQYTYDASGERVLKADVDFTTTSVNGTTVSNLLTVQTPTTYPSAFMVVDPQGNCSNHYYLGSQRIVSRISDKTAAFYESNSLLLRQSANTKKANKRSDNDLKLLQKNDLQALLDKANLGKVTYANYKPYTYEEIEKALKEEKESDKEPSTARMAHTNTNTSTPVLPAMVTPLFFYHPDHLGTSTFLTDANGNPYQFFLNLPFGETMAEQLPSSSYTSPYKFNGKELDGKTGLYYYGARYYDPKGSIWLSIDPLAEKFPGYSPYNYTMNNPINMVDPDGRAPLDWYRNNKTGNISWHNGNGAKSGYTNIGTQTNVATGTGQNLQLNSNGTFKDLNSGKSYGANSTVIANTSTRETVTSISNSKTLEAAGKTNDYVSGVASPLAKFGSSSNIASQTFSATVSGAAVSDNAINSLGTLNKVSTFGNVAGTLGKAAPFISVGVGALQIQEGYNLDGGTFGKNAQQATGGAVGSMVDGYAGAEVGAAAGAAIGVWFGGVGAVPGAIIGGVIGGIGGGMAGEQIGKKVVE